MVGARPSPDFVLRTSYSQRTPASLPSLSHPRFALRALIELRAPSSSFTPTLPSILLRHSSHVSSFLHPALSSLRSQFAPYPTLMSFRQVASLPSFLLPSSPFPTPLARAGAHLHPALSSPLHTPPPSFVAAFPCLPYTARLRCIICSSWVSLGRIMYRYLCNITGSLLGCSSLCFV
ncbi:hypothetical protein B0H17DRAFT_315631 [Mycena rosella]|uniref:Uncharacterized protein n=1 Tax=Mycena rosella TaxID=1033263 RepID=A0AAD7DTZ6_MYCRO|nr:hypothetical protein B0H17DRAFT_315631 [Mycena rosella]